MKRHEQSRKDLIDLGSVTVETKGATGFYSDEVLKRDIPGISAE